MLVPIRTTLVCRVQWGQVWNLLICPSQGHRTQGSEQPAISASSPNIVCTRAMLGMRDIWKYSIEYALHPFLQQVGSDNNLTSPEGSYVVCSQSHIVVLGMGLPHSQRTV